MVKRLEILSFWLVVLGVSITVACMPAEASEDTECVVGWVPSISDNVEKYTVYINGTRMGDSLDGIEYRTGMSECSAGVYTVTATNTHGQESIHSTEYVVGAAPEPATGVTVRIEVNVAVSVEVGE